MGNCDSNPDDVYEPRRGRWHQGGRQPWQSHTQSHRIGGGMYRGDPMMMPPGGGFPGDRMYGGGGGMPPPGYSRFGGGGGDMFGGGPYGGGPGGPFMR